MTEEQKVKRVIDAARSLVRGADEFWPEYPEALGEDIDRLVDAVGDLADDFEVEPIPINLPLYEG